MCPAGDRRPSASSVGRLFFMTSARGIIVAEAVSTQHHSIALNRSTPNITLRGPTIASAWITDDSATATTMGRLLNAPSLNNDWWCDLQLFA